MADDADFIRWVCGCGKRLKAPPGTAGKKAACQRCGAEHRIPGGIDDVFTELLAELPKPVPPRNPKPPLPEPPSSPLPDPMAFLEHANDEEPEPPRDAFKSPKPSVYAPEPPPAPRPQVIVIREPAKAAPFAAGCLGQFFGCLGIGCATILLIVLFFAAVTAYYKPANIDGSPLGIAVELVSVKRADFGGWHYWFAARNRGPNAFHGVICPTVGRGWNAAFGEFSFADNFMPADGGRMMRLHCEIAPWEAKVWAATVSGRQVGAGPVPGNE